MLIRDKREEGGDHGGREALLGQKILSNQCTSSGKSLNVKAEGFAWKKFFQALSFLLFRNQLVSEEARGTY